MKKILALTLAFIMCLSFVSCSGEKESATNEVKKKTTEEKVKAPEGRWDISLWFATLSYNFNENTTYETDTEKGTFYFDEKRRTMNLSSPGGATFTDLKLFGDYLYNPSRIFTADVEYGLKFSPNEEGRCNQKFETTLLQHSRDLINETFYDRHDYQKYRHEFSLELKEDGTFAFNKILYYYLEDSDLYAQEERMEYSGTYEYSDSILLLTPSSVKKYGNAFVSDRFTEMPCDGKVCPMYADETGIYYFTFQKAQ